MTNERVYSKGDLCLVIAFATLVRWSVSLHPYSGQSKPPMYGDYEAQRHWMEITVNLPSSEWYFNTSKNDLMYWGLDYPPLTAYHSYINGIISRYIQPDFVELGKSRGYESTGHKFFMRASVLATDLLIYFIAVILFFGSVNKNQDFVDTKHEVAETGKAKLSGIKIPISSVNYLTQISVALLYPGLILIDHGHFQYNSISLGFTILAVTCLIKNSFVSSAFFFCLALNYKQMSLYHSLPFFVYILSMCLQLKKSHGIYKSFQQLLYVSLTVILTFGFLWFPFLSKAFAMQVIERLFPVSRGIFEDKVSNFWCALNVLYKLNNIPYKGKLVNFCIVLVLGGSSFSLINLYRHPTILRFLLSLINVSLSFFLFSYQVHEKTILLVAIPVLLYFPYDPFMSFWFLIISNFSMLPLFLKDKLLIPFVALSLLFILFVHANVNIIVDKKFSKSRDEILLSRKKLFSITKTLFKISICGCIILFLCSILIEPPAKYPDIWPLLISMYSFSHFIFFIIYFNVIQVFEPLD